MFLSCHWASSRHCGRRAYGIPSSGPPLIGILIGILVGGHPCVWAQPANPTRLVPRPVEAPITPITADEPESLRFARVTADAEPVRSQGQVWREYDLRMYLQRTRGTAEPLQHVMDWILRETGTDQWFGSVPGMISAEGDRLRVYHLPEVHAKVQDVVERFSTPSNADLAVDVQLVTVESVNWRAGAIPMMQALTVKTPGVEAWVLSREHASLLLAKLRQRVDFRQHNLSPIQIGHGQTHSIKRWQPRSYPQSVQLTPGRFPGYQVQSGQIHEGYALKISPLAERERIGVRRVGGGSSGTAEWMQAVVHVKMDQIEKLASMHVDVPAAPGQPKRVEIQVPQVASWNVQERFRWPKDRVLLVSRGMVGMPGLKSDAKGIRLPGSGPNRVDALLFLECVDTTAQTGADTSFQEASRRNYHNRY